MERILVESFNKVPPYVDISEFSNEAARKPTTWDGDFPQELCTLVWLGELYPIIFLSIVLKNQEPVA